MPSVSYALIQCSFHPAEEEARLGGRRWCLRRAESPQGRLRNNNNPTREGKARHNAGDGARLHVRQDSGHTLPSAGNDGHTWEPIALFYKYLSPIPHITFTFEHPAADPGALRDPTSLPRGLLGTEPQDSLAGHPLAMSHTEGLLTTATKLQKATRQIPAKLFSIKTILYLKCK